MHPVAVVLLLGITHSGPLLAQTCVEGTTKCISGDTGGDCSSIGTWNAASKTCTLTGDLAGEAIQIAGDDVALDGGGHTLTGLAVGGLPQAYGVYVEQRTGVTVTNLILKQFQAAIEMVRCSSCAVKKNTVSGNARAGIELLESNHNTVGDNTLKASGDGIVLKGCADNILAGNLSESNRDSGIILNYNSSGNTVTRNVTRLNSGGIALGGASSHNTISDNDVSENRHLGIALYFSSNENVVIHNRIAGNAVGMTNGAGVLLMQVSGNRFSNNTVAGNSRGIWFSYPGTDTYPGGGNEVYQNNFIDNGTQALITGWRRTPDSFSKHSPIGGNFWGNWTTPDLNGDGVVDSPYLISGGGDSLPWSAKNGWLTPPDVTPPETISSSPGRRW